MLSDARTKSANPTDSRKVTRRAGSFVTKRVWLPKRLYDAIPYFYFAAGVAAFLATLYIGNWVWILPHYLLFSAACLHIGVLILRRRSRPPARRNNGEPDTD